MILSVLWTAKDIQELKPEWSEDKCRLFLEYVRQPVMQAAERAGTEVIERVLEKRK